MEFNNRYPLMGTVCERAGHAPPDVNHLPGGRTAIRCPRCGKTVYEQGLTDHPDHATIGG